MKCSWTSRQSFFFLAALFIGLGLYELWRAQAVVAAPQGQLETPTPGSAQSGIGLIRGWVCTASRVDIEVVGRGALTAVYGEAREDTSPTCEDSNNGFSLQFNWSDLGEGVHTVRAVADGEEFGRAAVTVGTLGRPFFPGAPQSDFPITNFPASGQTTLLRWLESRQQFVLSNGGTPPTEGSSPRADAKLEDPGPGSFQSGIGLIRGWVCSANQVEVEIEGRGKVAAVYGEPRGDTQAACGDSNNGFSAQVNWNDFGDGNYTVRALADGVEFGRAAFTVVTLGLGSFPTGLTGTFTLPDFPQQGRQATVEWQESQQNFVVTAASQPGTSSGLSGRQQGPIVDGDGSPGLAEITNRGSSTGNWLRSIMQDRQQAAVTVAAGDREQRAASTENFFLCATSLSIEQGGQTFGVGSFRVVDVAGNDVCQELPPGTTFPILLQIEATSSLNFNAPFTVKYNSRDVTQFQSSGPPPAAVLTVTPEQVIFDVLPTGSSQDKTLTISNPGSEVLTGGMTLIASGSGAGVFTLVSADTLNVAPGQSQVVTVRYTAGSSEVLTGSLRISTNAGVKTVILQGQGERPPQLSVKPASVNFGTVQDQGTATATFTVANSGGGVLTGSVSTAAPFSIVSGGSFTLSVGQQQAVTVRVTGGTRGPVSAPATVTSNGGGATVTLSATFATTGGSTPAPQPQLCTTPSMLDFGAVTVNTTSERTVTVENCGDGGTLTGSVSTATPFSVVSGGSFNLEAGQSQEVTVRFSPTGAGAVSGSATVSSNGGAATVTLNGQGATCTFTLSANSAQVVAAGGPGSVSVSVSTASGCSWTATSNVPWITITSGSSGSGNGTVSYTVAANPDVSSRAGTLTIAGQTFTVTQGARPLYLLTIGKTGTGSGTVTSSPGGINCGTDCTESYIEGTVVTLTATVSEGSTFAGWTGDCLGEGLSISVTMTTNRSCTATFNVARNTQIFNNAADFRAALGGVLSLVEDFESRTVGDTLKGVEILPGLVVDTNMANLMVFSGSSGDPLVFGFDNTTRQDGNAFYALTLTLDYTALGFVIEGWDPASPGPITLEITFSDGSVQTIELTKDSNLSETDPVFFGIISNELFIDKIVLREGPEISGSGNEEVALDDIIIAP